jgi:integrase
MRTNNPDNERIKHRYFSYLREAKRRDETTIDSVAAALHRFGTFTGYRDFKAFHYQQAVAFKRHLSDQVSQRSGSRLSKATVYSTLTALRHFFFWLAGQPGFRSRLTYSDVEYFNISEKDARIAKARREARRPTLDQVRHALAKMPATTEIERRDRAVFTFVLLTGARDGALVSLKLKHVDLTENKVSFDAREVHTKFSKTFNTDFFPVGDDVRQIMLTGSNTCCVKNCLDLMIRYFLPPRSHLTRINSSPLLVCPADTGAMQSQSETSSGRHSLRPGCPISSRTACAKRSRRWARSFAIQPKSTRPGARI